MGHLKRFGYELNEFMKFIVDLGYEVHKLESKGNELKLLKIEDLCWLSGNYFFIRPDWIINFE